MGETQVDGALGNPFVEGDDLEFVQESPGRRLEVSAGTDHDFHPGDDADALALEAVEFQARIRNRVEVVDEHVRVEQAPYHSPRSFS